MKTLLAFVAGAVDRCRRCLVSYSCGKARLVGLSRRFRSRNRNFVGPVRRRPGEPCR